MAVYEIDSTNDVSTIATDVPAFELQASDTLTLKPSGLLEAKGTDADGIRSKAAGTTIIIEGNVSATGTNGNGIVLLGASTLTVRSTGHVTGTWGVELSGSNSITNEGEIRGSAKALLSAGTSAADVLTLVNSGKIVGAIETSGASNITNTGTISSYLSLGNFDDVYRGETGVISGTITLGGGHDKAYGGANAETMFGGLGDDTLNGGGGGDRLYAGAGTNLIDGGSGGDTITKDAISTDTIIGGADSDTLIYSTVAGITVGLTLNLSVTTAQNTGYGIDTISEIEHVNATAYADVLTGNAAANSLTGNGGADVLRGEDGNDTLNGGADADALWGGLGNDRLLGGIGADVMRGDDGNDTLYGEADADSLWGGTGNDGIDAGSGADTLYGEGGDDTLVGGADSDQIWAGEGNDGLNGGTGNDLIFGETGNDTLIGGSDIDVLWGGVGDDYLGGDAGNDALNGEIGADTLSGGADADVLRAGSSNDSLDGGTGNDTLYGDPGNDTLFGGAENDFLNGGTGKDYLSGGVGRDLFGFTHKPSSRTNVDTIADFNVRDDSIYLDNSVFKALGRKGTATKPVKLNKKMFSVGLTIDSKDDHIIYDKKSGVLYFDDDGTGVHKAVPIAVLSKYLKLTYHDFFVI